MSSTPRPLVREQDGSFSAGGVWLGSQVARGVFLEPVEDGRHEVRQLSTDGMPVRRGEVMGGRRRHQAFDTKGRLIAIERSLAAAAQRLCPP